MEIVSELLGHSSMKVTQDSYGKIVQRKISLEMQDPMHTPKHPEMLSVYYLTY